jgi:hypothetical protein
VPKDKTPANRAPNPSSTKPVGEDPYRKLVQRHQSIVEDYSRIEAKIRSLETQLEKVLLPS